MNKRVRLSEEADLITKGTTPTTIGKDFVENGVPFLRAQNVINGEVLIDEDILFIDYQTHNNELKRSQILKGDLLITIAGTIGRTAIVKKDLNGLNCNQAVAIIRINSKRIDLEYLKRFIETEDAQRQFNKSKVTATISNLSLGQVGMLEIPLYPLDTQKKIAAILDAADAYRQKTKTLIEKYDQLAQSLFLDMFGDPFKSNNKFKKIDFELLTERITYGFTNPMKHLDKGIHILTAKNIQNGFIDYENVHYADITEYKELTSKSKPDKNDILITKDGSIGRTALFEADFPVCINQSVTLVKPNHNLVNARYLVAYLISDSVQSRIQNMGKGGGLKHLQITELAKFPTVLPEINVQNQFVARIQLIEAQKQQAQASLQKAEDLFNSLLQRAFKGELVS